MTEEAHPTATFLQVQTPDVLEAAAARWRQTNALALDLEFVRTRTFYPKLGLIQVADGHQQYLVDPLAIEDLSPLWDVLRDEKIDILMHLAAESHVDRSIDGPEIFIQTNIIGTFRLLKAARAHFLQHGVEIVRVLKSGPMVEQPGAGDLGPLGGVGDAVDRPQAPADGGGGLVLARRRG